MKHPTAPKRRSASATRFLQETETMNKTATTATTTAITATPAESLQDIFRRLGRTSDARTRTRNRARTMDTTGDTIKRQIRQAQLDAAKSPKDNARDTRAAMRKNALEIILAGRRRRKEIKEILAQGRKHRAEIREILRRAQNTQPNRRGR